MRSAIRIFAIVLCLAAGIAAAVWLAQNAELPGEGMSVRTDSRPDRGAAGGTVGEPARGMVVLNPAAETEQAPSLSGAKVPALSESLVSTRLSEELSAGPKFDLPAIELPARPRVAQEAVEPDEDAPAPKHNSPRRTTESKESANTPGILDVLREVVGHRVPVTPVAAAGNSAAPNPSNEPPPTVAPLPPPPPPPSGVKMARPTQNAQADLPASAAGRNNKTTTQVSREGDNKLSLHLVDADIREVLQLLSRASGTAIMPSDAVQGNVTASLPNVDFDTALGAIVKSKGLVARREGNIVYVATADEFKKRENAGGKLVTRLYRPNYVRAAELQKLITPLLSPQVGMITVTSPAQVGIASDSAAAGGDEYANSDVVLVRDFENVLNQIDRVVQEVDIQPLQVAIEAMILSVKLSDTMDMGVDFEALRDNDHARIVSGSPITALTAAAAGKGLKVGFLDSSLSVFVHALETIGDTNVIATPRILALNKMRAEVLIGSQLGYISTTVTETSTTQSVQFLEVGTQLRIRPFISSDGMIRMEIHPELSTGQVRVEEGFTLPDKDVTGVTTNVMARDGSTVLIGGLIREDLDHTGTQIPFVGSIAGVGALFRQKKEVIDRREIIVLITPRIVCDSQLNREGNQGAMEFHQRQAIQAEKFSPFSRQHICKKYIYLAQQAWGEGKQQRALRLVNIAIQFDPNSRVAIDLRSDIAAGVQVGDHTGQAPFIPPGTPLDGEEVAPDLLDELDPAFRRPETASSANRRVPPKQVDVSSSGVRR